MCAWPPDRKGAHWVKGCHRPIKITTGPVSFPITRYQPKSVAVKESSESQDLDVAEGCSDDTVGDYV
jgi:hypothetical protein